MAALFVVLLFGAQKAYKYVFYSPSDVFINPVTSKVDTALGFYLSSLVQDNRTFLGSQSISVNYGRAPTDAVKSSALCHLSPLLRIYPDAYEFKLLWISEYEYELRYDRKKGELIEIQIGKSSADISRLIGKNITDKEIHDAAKTLAEYDSWAVQHWKR